VEKDKLEIYQQRFIGGRDFARRIYQRLTHQQKKGTRSRKSLEENRERLREEDENRAGRIVKGVAEYFGIQPELVKSGIRAGGATGKARAVLIALLRNQMPWTGKRIGEYIGIKREIYYYLRKVEGNKNQTQAFKTLSNIKYDGV
jgi:chromosomal replication initiation ATPase DnaA